MTDPTPRDAADASATQSRMSWRVALLICAITTLICYNGDVNGPLDLYHEGDRLAAYDAISAGALPFRDVYISHGLGEDVLKPYLACKLLGPSIESLRRIGQNTYIYRGYLPILGPLAILLAGIAWLRSPVSLAVLACLLSLGLFEISERFAPAMAAVAALGWWNTSRKSAILVLCGFLVGMALLYSTETGIYSGLAITYWLFFAPVRRLDRNSALTNHDAKHSRLHAMARWSLGMLIVAIPFILYCAVNGILADFAENLRIQFAMRSEVWQSIYPTPSWSSGEPFSANLLVAGMVVSIYYLLPLSYVVGIALSLSGKWLKSSDERRRLLIAALVGICFWLTPLNQSDLWHVAYATGAFFLFAATCADLMLRKCIRLAPGIPLSIILAPVIIALAYIGQGGAAWRKLTGDQNSLVPVHLQSEGKPLVHTDLDRVGNIRIPASQATELSHIVRLIQDNAAPDDYLLDLSDQPLLYFLAQRRSPTRFHLISQCNTPTLRQRMLDDILAKEKLPRLAILPGSAPPGPDALGRFVSENYRPLTSFADLQFLKLNRE